MYYYCRESSHNKPESFSSESFFVLCFKIFHECYVACSCTYLDHMFWSERNVYSDTKVKSYTMSFGSWPA